MKMPKALQLPSGSWRVQVLVDGKRVGITEPTEEEAILKAMNIKHGAEQYRKEPLSITLEEAYKRYIESKNSVLSPSTVYGYNNLKSYTFVALMNKPLKTITSDQVQREVNRMAKTLSPKTLRNAHGLLSSVLAEHHPGLHLRTTLPQKQRVEVTVPSEGDIKNICAAASGTEIELPVLLAIWLGLRASEICGIKWAAIKGNVLHVKEAKVLAEGGTASKSTKTYSGNRKLVLPQEILELINAQSRKNDYVIQLTGSNIYKRFVRLCKKHSLPHFRFHDLRHANASVMLSMGIPDKYAMERMGHATNNMLKTVYQHTMSEKTQQVNDQVNNYFSNLVAHSKE